MKPKKQQQSNATRSVHLITTGGTIEKSYDELEGSLENRTSFIKAKIISQLRLPYSELNFHPLMAKDSLTFTESDRRVVFNQISTLLPLERPILVLHGTDTMEVTAAYCFNRLKKTNVPIIFTGAMRPFGFENSDALQNVTEALFAAYVAAPGVYISFHGCLWSVPFARKNKLKGTFEACSEPVKDYIDQNI
ncbi:MAG: asparaginase domain-containing protein [Bdellovibrionota bacterium]